MATQEDEAASEVSSQMGRALEQIIEANSLMWMALMNIVDQGHPISGEKFGKALTLLRNSKQVLAPDSRPELIRFDHAAIDAVLEKINIGSGAGDSPKRRPTLTVVSTDDE